jgi:glycosyltransferase involved in cell wall biosynthesis
LSTGHDPTRPGILFSIPVHGGRASAIDPVWVQAAGLAEGFGRALGSVTILCPGGYVTPESVRQRVLRRSDEGPTTDSRIRWVPKTLRVGAGDLRAWWRAREMRDLARRATDGPFALVVHFHRRFQDSGVEAARRLGIPLVIVVEALEVREEASWGVTRPGWGKAVEWFGEARLLRRGDLLLPLTRLVDMQLGQIGIPQDRRVIVPTGADLSSFRPGPPDGDLKRKHGLDAPFVVGWVGGFRPFHGLEAIPEIARGIRRAIPGALLCLIGTGPLRDHVARATRGMEDIVRLVGPVPHHEVPGWMRLFDAALLLSGPGPFHYSPLKLHEYMASGLPTVAAQVGDVPSVISSGRNGLLVPPQDPASVVQSLALLASDPALRTQMGFEARRTAERELSWDARVRTIVDALADRGLLRPPILVR